LAVVPRSVVVVEHFATDLLRTQRLTLRPLRESDRGEFLRVIGISCGHLAPFSRLHREGEADDQLFERQLRLCHEGDQRGAAWRRIATLDDGRIAGAFNLNAITRGISFEADANCWISADQTRRGLATEGLLAMLDHALADLPRGLGLHRVNAAIMPADVASIRLAARAGLRKQSSSKVSIRLGDRWELHEIYERSADAAFAQASSAA
jgi:ribosomal-protein-alanine N-acetyltransferase